MRGEEGNVVLSLSELPSLSLLSELSSLEDFALTVVAGGRFITVLCCHCLLKVVIIATAKSRLSSLYCCLCRGIRGGFVCWSCFFFDFFVPEDEFFREAKVLSLKKKGGWWW
ncbi:hypothetical protein HN51_050283 [Arachis hypogaea]